MQHLIAQLWSQQKAQLRKCQCVLKYVSDEHNNDAPQFHSAPQPNKCCKTPTPKLTCVALTTHMGVNNTGQQLPGQKSLLMQYQT